MLLKHERDVRSGGRAPKTTRGEDHGSHSIARDRIAATYARRRCEHPHAWIAALGTVRPTELAAEAMLSVSQVGGAAMTKGIA